MTQISTIKYNSQYDLIILPSNFWGNYFDALHWAESVGGDLPTYKESDWLFKNYKDDIIQRYYWCKESHDTDYAIVKSFRYGFLYKYQKNYREYAIAIKRKELK